MFTAVIRSMVAVCVTVIACQAAATVDAQELAKKQWTIDFPVQGVLHLPGEYRESPVGIIDSSQVWEDIWSQIDSETPPYEIDFKTHLVAYGRNTDSYNSFVSARVELNQSVLELKIVQDRTAYPIRESLQMVLFVVPKQGIKSVAGLGTEIQLPDSTADQMPE